MKHNKQNLDAIIDAAAREIRDEQIDESIIEQSATSVWARVSEQLADDKLANYREALRWYGDYLASFPTDADSPPVAITSWRVAAARDEFSRHP